MMPSPENDLSKYTFSMGTPGETQRILNRIAEFRALREGPYRYLSLSEAARAIRIRRLREQQAAQAHLGLSEHVVAQGTPVAATTAPEAAQVAEPGPGMVVEAVPTATVNPQTGVLVQEPS